MDILEDELEDIIYQMFKDKSDLVYDLNCNSGIIIRQPVLSSYGRADLINIEYAGNDWECINFKDKIYKGFRQWSINVIELKRDKIGYNEVGQICRYLKGLKEFIQTLKLPKDRFYIKGILIGKRVEENGDFVYLLDQLNQVDVFTYSLDYKTGLNFSRSSDWRLMNVDFTNTNLNFNISEIKNLIREHLQEEINDRKSYNKFKTFNNGSV